MEKKHLKRLGYGFSALVLGLSAVGYFPTARTYAEPITSATESEAPATESEAPATELEVPAAESEAVEGEVSAGNLEAPATSLETSLDSAENILLMNPATNPTLLNVPANEEEEGDEDGEDVWTMPKFENNIIVRAITVDEPFIFVAAPGANPIIWDVTESSDDEMELMDAALINDTEAMVRYYGDMRIYGLPALADPEDVTVEETDEGEYTVIAAKPGIYRVMTMGYIEGENTFLTTTLTLTAVTSNNIKDILNANNSDGKAMWEASKEYFATIFDPELTDEERAAAEEKYWETMEELETRIELRNENAFGDDIDEIMNAVNTGKTISTEVRVTELKEADVDEVEKDALLNKLDVTFASNVKFYDVDVVVYADGEEIGTLKELTGKETVIMTGYEAAPAGYKRVYKVMSYHAYIDENGEEQVEIVEIENADFDEETGAIIFDADRFSTYLVAYKDVFAPSVNTGVFTGEGGSANASVILPVILATVIIILAGAFKFAKK